MRPLSLEKLLNIRYRVFDFEGLWEKVFGQPEQSGIWILYGPEKNGKTWFALKIAEYLSSFKKVLYISAEEGTAKTFTDACKRAKVSTKSRNLKFTEYKPVDELESYLRRPHTPRIVFIDNMTVYGHEMNTVKLAKLTRDFPKVLFVFMAHEEKGEPLGAKGQMIKRLASVIIRIVGLTAFIGGRVPGGQISIDEEKAMLYWGAPDNEE